MVGTNGAARRSVRILGFTGDGTATDGQTATITLKDETGAPMEGITISFRVIPKADAMAHFTRATRQVEQDDGSFRSETDFAAGLDALCVEVIEDWDGFVGMDDQPLVVTPETISAIDASYKAQVSRALQCGEVRGRGPASFR